MATERGKVVGTTPGKGIGRGRCRAGTGVHRRGLIDGDGGRRVRVRGGRGEGWRKCELAHRKWGGVWGWGWKEGVR
ncbi:hypothetical protein NSERKGN1266_29720 [Nocardia seriolae]|nr:hypothetical protein NSERKGN1266_29720 [Nocardia seriolae]